MTPTRLTPRRQFYTAILLFLLLFFSGAIGALFS